MKSILIVEDDLYIRDIYKKTLTNAGYAVEVAVDGEEAVIKASAAPHDLIMLDIMLPKRTGLEVLQILRSHDAPTANTLIFMLTNLGEESMIKLAFKSGADGYFIKVQLELKDLVAEVNKIFAEIDSMPPRQKT